MYGSTVETKGVVVSPLSLIHEKTGLYAQFNAVLHGFDECECLVFGLLGIEIMSTLRMSDRLSLEGMLFIRPDDSKRLYVFDCVKTI